MVLGVRSPWTSEVAMCELLGLVFAAHARVHFLEEVLEEELSNFGLATNPTKVVIGSEAF